MSEESAFVRTIRQQPEQELPRLIYADWLEEQGDPRCQLIRLQCERTRWPERSSRAVELDRAVKALLKQHHSAWRKPLDQWGVRHAEFRRGLLEMVHISAEDLARWHHPLFEFAPFLCEVKIKHLRHRVAAVEHLPELGLITHLNLRCGGLRDGELRRLFQHDGLNNLEHLDLGFNELRGELLRILDQPRFAGLKTLDLACNSLGSLGAELLASLQHLTRLETLNLRQTDIGSGGASALVGSPAVSQLRRLNLAYNDLRQESVKALSESPHLRNLEELSLGGIRLANSAIKRLGRSESLNALQVLDLRHVHLRPQDINTLGSSLLGKRLRLLRVHPDFFPYDRENESLQLLRSWFGERLSVENTFPG